MTMIQDRLEFPASPAAIVEVPAQQPVEVYEQLIIPYANEGTAVLELLSTLGELTAKKAMLSEDTQAITDFREHDPEHKYSYGYTNEAKRVLNEVGDIQKAAEIIVANDGDLDEADIALRREYDSIDSSLPDDVLVFHTGYRGLAVRSLIKMARDPFKASELIAQAKNTRGLHISSTYGNAVNWLKLNARRFNDGEAPVVWNGNKTDIYWGETIENGMVAPAHDYVWLSQAVDSSTSWANKDSFIKSLYPPFRLRENDPWS